MDKKGIRKSYPSDVTDKQWKEIEPLYTGMRNCELVFTNDKVKYGYEK